MKQGVYCPDPMDGMNTTTSAAVKKSHNSRFRVALSLLCLAGITAAATWLRLYQIGAKSLWNDEGGTTAYMRMDWYNLARLFWRREGNMSFYFLLLTGWIQFGDSVEWVRGFSALMAVATIPVMYALGKRLFGTAAGLTSALLMTVSAYHVRYAQEARSYSLAMLLVTLATYFLVCAMESGRRSTWRWYVLCCSLAVYTHFFAVLVVAAHWASLRVLPTQFGASEKAADAQQDFVRALRKIGLWTSPAWIFIATTGVGVLSWMRRPGRDELYNFLEQFAGNGGLPLLGLYLICGGLAAGSAWQDWRRTGRSFESWRYAVLASWLVTPVVITLAATLVKPVFLPRYVSISLPAIFLIAAAGLTSLRRSWLALPLLALLVWSAVGGIRSYYEKDFDLLRSDYRSASAYVLANASPGDAILFYPGYGRFAYEYYSIRATDAKAKPAIAFPGKDGRPVWRDFLGQVTPQVVEIVMQNYHRVWVVLSNYAGPESEDKITLQTKGILARRCRLVDTRDFPGLRLYLYEIISER